MLVDAHCHPTEHPETMQQLTATTTTNSRIYAAAMSTDLPDFPLVALLAKTSEYLVPAYGLHPWCAHRYFLGSGPVPGKAEHYKSVFDNPPPSEIVELLPEPESFDVFLQELKTVLIDDPTAIIGECGLDKPAKLKVNAQLISSRTNLSHQLAILRSQLMLAVELQRPVSLHCVQAHQLLFELVSEHSNLPAVCLHSYSGSPEMYEQQWLRLQPVKVFVSISSLVNLRQAPRKLNALLEKVPASRILSESDCSHAEQSELLVRQSLTCISAAHRIPQNEAEQTVEQNFRDFITF